MLDFRRREKKRFNVTLHDGTKLQIPTPTISVYNAIMEISSKVDKTDITEVYQVVREVLMSNKAKVKITDEQLEAFDLADIYDMLIGYMEFVQGALSDPNSKSPTTP